MKKRTEIVTRERSLDRREGGALGLFIENRTLSGRVFLEVLQER